MTSYDPLKVITHASDYTSFELFGLTGKISHEMTIMTYFVIVVLTLLSFLASRKPSFPPRKGFFLATLYYEAIENLVLSTMGEENRRYIPLIGSLFVFIFLSSILISFPPVFQFLGFLIALPYYFLGGDGVGFTGQGWTGTMLQVSRELPFSFLFTMPYFGEEARTLVTFHEPTRDLSTCAGLGIMVHLIAHGTGIFRKGLFRYLAHYGEPGFKIGKWTIPNPGLFLLEIVGEIGKLISHFFRLFGNILGGYFIIMIISVLLEHLFVPIALLAYFGLFISLLQAFVFTMLATVYISIAIREEEH